MWLSSLNKENPVSDKYLYIEMFKALMHPSLYALTLYVLNFSEGTKTYIYI